MVIMKTPVENAIAKEFFIDFTNTTLISRKLYPKSGFKKNHRSVSRYVSEWNKKGYLEKGRITIDKINKRGTEYTQAIPTLKLNLNFYFDYVKDNLKKDNLNSIERKILNYIFSFKEVREIVCKSNSLIEGINSFLRRIFLFNDVSDTYPLG